MSERPTTGTERSHPVPAGFEQTEEANGQSPRPATHLLHAPHSHSSSSSKGTAQSSFDTWGSLIEALLRRWRWLAQGGGVLALLGFLLGLMVWRTHYSVSTQLIRYDSPTSQEVFGYRQISGQTLASVLRTPELLRRVAANARPPMSEEALAANLRITPDRNGEMMTATLFGRDGEAVVDLANLFAREAVQFTGEVQARTATEVRDYQRKQLVQIEGEIAKLNQQLPLTSAAMPRGAVSTALPARPVPLFEKLQVANAEMVDLLARYTEAHPFVKEQRAKITAIERQLTALGVGAGLTSTNGAAAGEKSDDAKEPVNTLVAAGGLADGEIVRSKLQSLENSRLQVLGRERAAQSLVEAPPGHFRVFSEATTRDLTRKSPWLKIICFTVFCGLAGTALVASVVLFQEFADDHLHNASDIRRVTHLPVLATLGDLQQMQSDEREDWAFRTWTALQSRLSPSPNHGLVCGVTSASHGEGCSTWVRLLAEAASQRGFRVLTIATRTSQHAVKVPEQTTGVDGEDIPPAPNSVALATNVLASPAEVAEKLVGPNAQPLVHIPVPGWVWNLDRRKQWKAALQHWGEIDNVVILVELPPASVPEAVLLGENLPNLIWLADSGKANAAKTRAELETLRHARCNLAGAVLNHEPDSLAKNLFPRWLGTLNGAPA
jgi:capsular polysaccharide biosynthesis protein